MFQVTLHNLSRDARTPVEGAGRVDLGTLTAPALTEILAAFVAIDPVENVKADPEIRVQARRDRFVIRTGEKKLFLQDARNLSEPAYVLSVGEIIAELDGSAAARRTTPPIPFIRNTDFDRPADLIAESTPAVSVTTGRAAPSTPWGLVILVSLLAGYIVYSTWTNRGSPPPPLTALTAAERMAEDGALTGVYMTGSEPGHHGIIILGDGKLKLFQVNSLAAPSVVHGTYRLGRLDSVVCLRTDQPGGLIKVTGRESLTYCGETYAKIP